MFDPGLDKWEVQLRKGVLEMVILLSLRRKEQYGFELIAGIARGASFDLPEGTLYPLLLRLGKEGLITARTGESSGGAPRKYFSLTPHGHSTLADMVARWRGLSRGVEQMIGEPG